MNQSKTIFGKAINALMCAFVFVGCSVGSSLAPNAAETPLNLFPDNVVLDVPSVSVSTPSMPSGNLMTSEDQVDLLADMLQHDETGQIITAFGNVEMVQAGQVLRADEISYNLTTDIVQANGNVVLNDTKGDVYFAENFQLSEKMKEGFVTGLKGLLADGSRFTAKRGTQTQKGDKLALEEATYTPCEPCKANPENVLWQLKADEVTHHKDQQRISYKNARFELGGVPILYTPYFSHADGSVDRKSGFLTPRAGYDSELGAIYEQQYYWDIAPNRDATIGLMALSSEAPVVKGQYRHRFENASFQGDASATFSERSDRDSGIEKRRDADFRGHLFSESIWDINDKWRAGLDLEVTSDDQYLRQYDITNEDVLENNLYLERFSDRNYALARMTAFQDVRVSERQEDQPNILPEIYSRFLGAPGETLGGRWSVEASALGLRREGSDQDVNRGTLEAGWNRRFVSDIGFVSTLDLMVRGDVYDVSDRNIAKEQVALDEDSSDARGFASGHFQVAYPLQKRFTKMHWLIEPMAALTSTSDVDVNNDVPNEDSQDVFVDPITLFSANRYPGYDRVEDRQHATYGLRTGLFGDNGYSGEIFFGQSYRFGSDDNPFPAGSGLSEDYSDYIGQISTSLGQHLNLDYRLQLDEGNLSSKRHEFDMVGRMGPFALSTRYFYTAGLQGTDLDESREQMYNGLTYNIDDEWYVFGSSQYDFDRNDEGFRLIASGFGYNGQCLTFSLTGQKTFTRDTSGDSDTEIMARIGLKNLGEFETSGISIDSSRDDDDENEIEEAIQ